MRMRMPFPIIVILIDNLLLYIFICIQAKQPTSKFNDFSTFILTITKTNTNQIVFFCFLFCDEQDAYKDWLCSMLLPFHMLDTPIKPCSTICERVEQACPYLHPASKEQYAGEPIFICIGQFILYFFFFLIPLFTRN